jgi:hypothetical protein
MKNKIKVVTLNILFSILFLEVFLYFLFPFIKNQVTLHYNGQLSFHLDSIQFVSHLMKKNTSLKPHPFFGFINSNNDFERNLLTRKPKGDKNEFIIAIFGGSVAHGIYEVNKTERTLEKYLGGNKLFRDKKIKVINFSAGGLRQPQSIHIANMFSQFFDLSINIEGSNEVAYFYHQHPHYYPMHAVSNIYFSGLKRLSRLPILLKLNGVKKEILKRIKKDQYLLKTRKTIDYIFLNQIYNYYSFVSKNTKPELNKLSKDYFLNNYNFWLLQSCSQQNMLKDRNIKSLYIKQPIPAFGKKVTSNELKYIEFYKPHLLGHYDDYVSVYKQEVERLVDHYHFNLYDFTSVFSRSFEETYIDGCCHLNRTAQRMFLDKIAKLIIAEYEFLDRRCDWKALEKKLKGDL